MSSSIYLWKSISTTVRKENVLVMSCYVKIMRKFLNILTQNNYIFSQKQLLSVVLLSVVKAHTEVPHYFDTLLKYFEMLSHYFAKSFIFF